MWLRPAVSVAILSLCVHGANIPYSEELAIKYSRMAGAPYCYEAEHHDVVEWDLAPTCKRVAPDFHVDAHFFDESLDAYGVVGHSDTDKTIVASFKGTTPSHIRDWLVDFKSMVHFPDACALTTIAINAHAGFCEEYLALKGLGLYDAVLEAKAKYPTYQLVSVGHSLGGAVASLFALDVLSAQASEVVLYTFGQPRTGAQEYAETFQLLVDESESSAYFRITHHKDLVAHVPLCSNDGYGGCEMSSVAPIHTGLQVHYPEDMTETYFLCGWEDGDLCSESFPISIENHSYYFGEWVSQMCCPAQLEASPGHYSWANLQHDIDSVFADDIFGPIEVASE